MYDKTKTLVNAFMCRIMVSHVSSEFLLGERPEPDIMSLAIKLTKSRAPAIHCPITPKCLCLVRLIAITLCLQDILTLDHRSVGNN